MQGGTIGARKEATMHRPMVFSLIVLAVIATLSLGCSQTSSRADTERTAGDAIHDASITARIKTTYLFSGHLNPFRINVDTRDGVVTLHGNVPSDIHRDLAGEIAKNAEGVREVDNELRIAPGGGDGPDEAEKTFGEAVHDSTLTASVKMSLAFERGVKASHITVHTDRGTVTLTGEVDSEAERQLAARLARQTEGVKDVVNHLEVRG
jgi:osmotically-inducible protein OsmY